MGQTKPTDSELRNVFFHHRPLGDQQERYDMLRAKLYETAKFVRDLTPSSREQSRAINALDDALMLAIASIARN